MALLAAIFTQTALYIFVKNTRDQCLVRNTFSKGFFLQPPKISRRKTDIYSGIFFEHGFSIFLMPFLRLGSVFRTFYLTRFKSL